MVSSTSINVKTKGNCDLVDITQMVAQKVEEVDIKTGTVTIFVAGSTAALTTIEFERGVLSDFCSMWERTVPGNIGYRHNETWGDGNGHSHVRSSLLGPSLVVPFVNKKLTLGTWQQIVLVDFDVRARSREVVLQIMGD